MRYKFVFLLVCVALVALSILWLVRTRFSTSGDSGHHDPSPAAEGTGSERAQAAIQGKSSQTPSAPTNEAVALPDVAYAEKAIAEQTARQKELKEQWRAQWSAPIHFYGRVVDES